MGICTSVCKRHGDLQVTEDDKLQNDFKEDLIMHYRVNESEIIAAPLVEEHKVPLEDLYVLPPMMAYKNPYNFGPGIEAQEKQETTISQLFLSEDNVRYRNNIYITANAGFGKTSLSQKLTMIWCQTHSPLESLTEKYENEELEAMKNFDFLFLLHLRDYQSEPQCNLDDLIMKMVSTYMSRKSQYTNDFLQRILHEKKCLIILDGLDEWSHPGHCTRRSQVPHNNHLDSCTVLTTTRDWKIGTIGLSSNHIDRSVEISKLDGETRKQLETNAVQILNKKELNLARSSIADFHENVRKTKIDDIIFIPYILLQLICLFFSGLPIGKSRCEIYSNITEFSLERGLNK